MFPVRWESSALSPGPGKKKKEEMVGPLSSFFRPASASSRPLAPGLPLDIVTRALGHTNFHRGVYLKTRERKGFGFGLAGGAPWAPGLLFALASACLLSSQTSQLWQVCLRSACLPFARLES